MSRATQSIWATLAIAIVYIILGVLGILDAHNTVVQTITFSVFVAAITYMSGSTPIMLMGVMAIISVLMYVFIPWNSIPYIGIFQKPLLIGLIFTAIFSIFFAMSIRLGTKTAGTAIQLFAGVGATIGIIYALLFAIYFIIYNASTFGVREWIITLSAISAIFMISTALYPTSNKKEVQNTIIQDTFRKYRLLFEEGGIISIEIGIIFVYLMLLPQIKSFFQHTIENQGGKSITDRYYPLREKDTITSYDKLTGGASPGYDHAISFWVYINSNQPSIPSDIEIFSYGNSPTVLYAPMENVLTIKSGTRIVGTQKNVGLQKWNHVLLNYSHGTMDVFLNGELAASKVSVPPYVPNDVMQVGTDDKLYGNIANVLYFKKSLNISTIKKLDQFNRP